MTPRSSNSNAVLVIGGLLATSMIVGMFGDDDGIPNSEDYEGADEEQEPTLTAQRMAMLAEIIEEALLLGYTEDEATAIAAIEEANNDADVLGLIVAFGTRYSRLWYSYTLPQAVNDFMNTAEKKELNDCLLAKGITYTFH